MASSMASAFTSCMDCTPSSIFYGDDMSERNAGSDEEDVVPPPPLTEAERLAMVMERFDLNYTQISEYRDTFDRLDTDNYSLINMKKMRDAFFFWKEELTDYEFKEYFEKYDEGKSGYIEFPEFTSMLAEKAQKTHMEQMYAKKGQFHQHDAYNTGYVSKLHLYNGMRLIDKDGFDFDPKEMQKRMGKVLRGVNTNMLGEVKYMDVIKVIRHKGLLE
uniref:EF-hand domain-containing protein n=1 Tax=Chaetoceros debilis TaxID=122233 RepID=A0A7S3V9I6_9STRA|mmetsp:Transcript_8858/g.13307  ORF Transcript_8858/g.13307 Transcript_8858/m.13307 type:complete len:217 (+) Transcript_8858:291-941(+)|eukprot:CAMPEP_0194077032 /NCGR_PEP_ID=MMETSP0149-20130528/3718_1 /TAXON_ID=122233 /ORGANISM="Chaetoceros debilis, Strain MM31A-1" /LENGTH=216 /DNA_ID=CAMNT_0038757925 /DNA_START=231 /DNA_END=881 /DNA_ORIENTATION=+